MGPATFYPRVVVERLRNSTSKPKENHKSLPPEAAAPGGFLYVLRVDNPIPRVDQRLGKNAPAGDQSAGKCSVIDLIDPAGGTSGLQNHTADVHFPDFRQRSGNGPAHGRIHIVPIPVHQHAAYDFNGSSGRPHPRHDLRAVFDDLFVFDELQNPGIQIISAVIFTVSAQKTGTDQNFHSFFLLFLIIAPPQPKAMLHPG